MRFRKRSNAVVGKEMHRAGIAASARNYLPVLPIVPRAIGVGGPGALHLSV